jgi:hypothetical protein
MLVLFVLHDLLIGVGVLMILWQVVPFLLESLSPRCLEFIKNFILIVVIYFLKGFIILRNGRP